LIFRSGGNFRCHCSLGLGLRVPFPHVRSASDSQKGCVRHFAYDFFFHYPVFREHPSPVQNLRLARRAGLDRSFGPVKSPSWSFFRGGGNPFPESRLGRGGLREEVCRVTGDESYAFARRPSTLVGRFFYISYLYR